jgi:uncharacterized membrane protein
MSLYTLALFAHLIGVLTLFIGTALQWLITLRLRRAQTVTQVREWSSLVGGVGRLGPVSGVLVIGAGIYMMVTTWSLTTPWIMVSLGAMALMMVFGMVISARQLRAIRRAATTSEAPTDSISPELRRQTHNPVLWVSTQLAASTALGIVFMMTIKPNLGGSIWTLVAALALGTIVGIASAKPHPTTTVIEAHANQARS